MAAPAFVTPVEIITSTALIFLAGVSYCLSAWVIPVILRADKPQIQIAQFIETIRRGMRYLHTSSQVLGALLVSLGTLLYLLSDPRWRVYALMVAVLAPISPYEIYFIFPINDRIEEMDDQLAADGGQGAEEKATKELKALLVRWQMRNLGRVIIPLITGLIGVTSLGTKNGI